MTDPVPSKELVSRLRDIVRIGPDNLGDGDAATLTACADEIENLRRENVRWENAHKILLDEIERLKRPAHEREPPHCSTCECGLVDVGRATQEPEAVRVHTGQPHVYGVVRPTNTPVCPCKGHPTNCVNHPRDCGCSAAEPCEQLEGACPNCNQWVVLKCPSQPPAPVTKRMRIAFQPHGRCLWHEDCPKSRSGIMCEVEHEESRSLLECLHCGQRGYYPKGAVGSVCVDVVESAKPPGDG